MNKPKKNGSGTHRRKFRRSLPDSLGALSSLVSFDDAETEESRDGCKSDTQESATTAQKPTDLSFESDRKLTRILSEPFSNGSLNSGGAPSLRKTLSQDWLKTNFSPRPGRESRRSLIWGSDCLEPQKLLSNVPSLRSIPEESELDQDDGSELSDENIVVEVDSRGKSVRGRQNTSVTSSIRDEGECGTKTYGSQVYGV